MAVDQQKDVRSGMSTHWPEGLWHTEHYGGQQPTDADRTAQHISPASVLRLIFQSAIRMS